VPRSLNEGFADFLSKLTPTPGETTAAKNHRASIEACLKTNFGSKRFFRTGSFGNGTSISGYSDVDYFTVIPTDKLKQDSGKSLTEIRDALANHFPFTGVRVSCPAVRIPFGTSAKESTEVVPADYIDLSSESYPIYEIADCSGNWMRSSPEAHNAYVRTIDGKMDGKVKPLTRFVKAWKYCQQVPISSFYLELRVAKYAAEEPYIMYSIDVERIFSLLQEKGLAAMKDPKGIAGYVAACSTQAQLNESTSKLATALSRARKAREAETKGDIKNAFYWWNMLYAEKFPN